MAKIKLSIIIAISLCILTISCKQNKVNPIEILEKSYEKCSSIKCGYYETTKIINSQLDSFNIELKQNCYFKKIENDSIFSFMFSIKNYNISFENTNPLFDSFPDYFENINALYDGEKLIWYSDKDTLAGLIKKEKITNENIKPYYKSPVLGTFYPVTYKDCYPFPDSIELNSENTIVKFIKNEKIEDNECYHISANINKPNGDKYTKIIYEFWINKENYLPIAFSIDREGDFFEKHVLTKYEFDNLQDNSVFELDITFKNLKLVEVEN